MYFDFADRVFKKVPVVSRVNPKPATQYMVHGQIKLVPDSITISGANPIIDTIDFVFTKSQDLVDLVSKYEDKVKLVKIRNVNFSENEVEVSINIEKFTEGTQKLKINLINVPDSVELRTFPNSVAVTYFVALSDYEKVLPQLFEVVVDYSDTEKQKSTLDVKITNQPSYIKSLRYNPKSVEYIIEKSNAKDWTNRRYR